MQYKHKMKLPPESSISFITVNKVRCLQEVKNLELASGGLNKSILPEPEQRYVTTFNPTSAKPGDELKNSIPRLKPGCCLVPETMYLLFDFKVSGGKVGRKEQHR